MTTTNELLRFAIVGGLVNAMWMPAAFDFSRGALDESDGHWLVWAGLAGVWLASLALTYIAASWLSDTPKPTTS